MCVALQYFTASTYLKKKKKKSDLRPPVIGCSPFTHAGPNIRISHCHYAICVLSYIVMPNARAPVVASGFSALGAAMLFLHRISPLISPLTGRISDSIDVRWLSGARWQLGHDVTTPAHSGLSSVKAREFALTSAVLLANWSGMVEISCLPSPLPLQGWFSPDVGRGPIWGLQI